MLKSINWKAIFKGCAWVICLAGIVVLLGFIDVKKQALKCTEVRILIPGADNFIEREEVDAFLQYNQGPLIGRSLKEINLNEIEEKMESNPYIAAAKIFADMDGVIHIEIKQRQPVLRVINAGQQDFYIDSFGLKMPVSSNFTANVLVANGNIRESFNGRLDTLSTKIGRDLFRTASFIKADTLWQSQIEQVFVDERNDMVLVPRVGIQRIILGNADSLEVKMNNLLAFYKKAMPKVGWDTYKTINIKYTNQVVCERVKPDSSLLKNTGLVSEKKPPPVDKVDSVVKDAIQKEIASEKLKALPGKTN